MDWILDFLDPDPPAYNRIRSEVFFAVAGADLIWTFCLLKKRYWLVALLNLYEVKQWTDCFCHVGSGSGADSN